MHDSGLVLHFGSPWGVCGMVDKQDLRMQSMQKGREASIIAGLVGPYLNDQISNLVAKMAATYRSGQMDYQTLLGAAAQITFCLDLMSHLESQVRQADHATKEELDGQKPRN